MLRALLIALLLSLAACGGVEGYEPEIAEYGDAVDAPEPLDLEIDTSTITSTTTSTVGR
jgi:hypothetical protein